MNDEKLIGILDNGQIILDNLIVNLEKIVENKRGPLWHSKNRGFVLESTAKLELLDREWRAVEPGISNQANISKRHQIIRQKISRVQQLISQYIILLEGSKSLIKGEIGRINKAKSIKGYRFKNCYRISGGQLC
jgi:hypothetical protein